MKFYYKLTPVNLKSHRTLTFLFGSSLLFSCVEVAAGACTAAAVVVLAFLFGSSLVTSRLEMVSAVCFAAASVIKVSLLFRSSLVLLSRVETAAAA